MILVYAVFGILILIGLWALMGLIRAMVQEGGPIRLLQNGLKLSKGNNRC